MPTVRALATKIVNLCVRAVVTRSGERYQAQWLGDRITSLVEHFQPQGLHFRVPVGAEAMLLAPCGEASASVLLGAHKRSAMPKDTLVEGEGGLHYLGTYGVFLAKDGVVHLGGGIGASDFVALAAKVKTELDRIKGDIDKLKSATSTGLGAVGEGAAASGSAAKTAFATAAAGTPTAPASVAATKVKAT